jgi:peptidyl-prolyl cis-trans isomerase D
MTNGRFDVNKWRQALADPSINWSPLEDRLRRSLPGQRLEERVVAGVKLSEPELERLFKNQYDRVLASFVLFPLDSAPVDSNKLNDAALRAYYDAHKNDFSGTEEVKAEVVQVPRRVGEDEDRATRLEAETIVAEARSGKDFAQLATERSEGPFAERGGDLGQDIPLSRLPPALQTAIDSLAVGGVTDPIREGNTYFIFRLNERKSTGPEPTFRLSQIQKPIRPSAESVQQDAELVLKLRKEATTGNLADVAAKRQLVSVNTGWFGPNQYVPVLMQLPQAQQWAGRAAKGEVSRAYSTETGWVIVQVTERRALGPKPFDDVKDEVRRAVEIDLRKQKPLADAEKLVQAVRGGQTLEQAAAAAGVTVAATDTFPRSRPDGRLTAFPRAIGLAFALPAGQVGGPVGGDNGVVVVRKNAEFPGNPAQYEQLKGQLSQTLLSNRQQRFLQAWIQDVVKEAEVKDLRQEIEESM